MPPTPRRTAASDAVAGPGRPDRRRPAHLGRAAPPSACCSRPAPAPPSCVVDGGRPDRDARLPRDLHPVAWWLWAIGLATAASLTTNPLRPAAAHGGGDGRRGRAPVRPAVGAVVPAVRRDGGGDRGRPGGLPARLRRRVRRDRAARPARGPAARTGSPGSRCSVRSPASPCWPACTTACGSPPSSSASARPTRWPTPSGCCGRCRPALYEIGTALVVAVTVLPQFADSARRVRAAQSLRGRRDRAGRRGCAASWCRSSRTPSSARWRWRPAWTPAATAARPASRPRGAGLTGALMLVGLGGICVGVYAVLDRTAPRYLALPMLARRAWRRRSSAC